MNKRKLVVMLTSLTLGVIGITYSGQANAQVKETKHIESNVVLLARHNVGDTVANYTISASNRNRAWNEAVRLHSGNRKNNCTYYLASLLRGAGVHVPSWIGYTTSLGDWLGQNGWKRSTNMSNLKPGDVVFSGDTHAYMFLSWADKSDLIANVNDEQMAAYDNRVSYERRLKGAHSNGTIPGEGNRCSYVRATYYMTPANDSHDSSGNVEAISGNTTIQSSIGWLRFRSGNSTNYSELGKIPTGTSVEVIGKSNGWYKVKYNGEIGWISGDYTNGIHSDSQGSGGSGESTNVSGNTTIQSSIGWLRFRRGSSTNYSEIGKIPTGTTVNVLGQKNGWYKVSYNGEIGWISGSYTTGVSQESKSDTLGSTRIDSSIGWLHLRAGYGTSYGILGKIPTGAQVKVYSKVGSWYKVEYNGQMGWIYSSYTTGIN
ncbi:SH3 domain-containing protein [uncultured Clostridium sp.]|jgi:uncharacterized protein YraI|uniref:SH3 domain-containing protein n=1 Tax=uncultured Clostridium sp. TaxID=59620 RepID=UPI0026124A34|nr:SH3 domain-containing protein [uncultured Clostridium sp.]